MKALLYPHYRQGAWPLSRERFKAVGKGAYDAAMAQHAAGAALDVALCEGGAQGGRADASLTSAERGT